MEELNLQQQLNELLLEQVVIRLCATDIKKFPQLLNNLSLSNDIDKIKSNLYYVFSTMDGSLKRSLIFVLDELRTYIKGQDEIELYDGTKLDKDELLQDINLIIEDSNVDLSEMLNLPKGERSNRMLTIRPMRTYLAERRKEKNTIVEP